MKHLKFFGKFIVSGIIAFALLNLISSVYCLSPLRVENEFGNTDYAWETDSCWMKMTEGISYGITDKNGFNNLKEYDNPDVLVLGSSHIEGMNVNQKHSAPVLLDEMFGEKYSVYNMGISGHTLFKVVQYLPKSIEAFENTPKYIIIESATTIITQQDVDMALSGNVQVTAVNNKGIIAKLQKLPFLRQVYHQLDSGMMDMLLPSSKASAVGIKSSQEDSINTIDVKPYDELLGYLQEVENETGAQILIVYHPFEKFEDDGSINFDNREYSDCFAEYADKYDIGFINLEESIEKEYSENKTVPHGFSTGALGEGHINKYGHKLFADEVYKYITEKEGE